MITSLPCAAAEEFLEDVVPSTSDSLEIVTMLAERVAAIHGAAHPYLLEVRALVAKLPSPAHFATLRALTSDFTLPTDACLSFRALYERLADLEETLRA